MKVFDCFMFFNELELLDIRLNILDSWVDKFVIVESPKTHSGKDKPLYYQENKQRFKKFNHKIIHLVFNDYMTEDFDFSKYDYNKEHPFILPNQEVCIGEAERSKIDDRLIPHYYYWHNEQNQRAYIINGLDEAQDDDIVMVSDLDEIPNMESILKFFKGDLKNVNLIYWCQQKLYYYYLNNYISEDWLGTYITKYKFIKDNKINHYRYFHLNERFNIPDAGWHFSFLGDITQVQSKLKSFVHQENQHLSEEYIAECLRTGKDLFKRNYKNNFVEIDSSFPEYIIQNAVKFEKFTKYDA